MMVYVLNRRHYAIERRSRDDVCVTRISFFFFSPSVAFPVSFSLRCGGQPRFTMTVRGH